ncbi:MAG: SemiSWEET transporter [Rickettsiales bacterium]|nr:SemiSWEET transporter [Rickettsiales bacterium]
MESLFFLEDHDLQIDIITFIAASLTTFSFLPQAIRTIKLKETRDLSLTMFLAMSVGVAFWLFLGLMYGNEFMVIANAITLALNIVILRLKLKYG